MPKQEQTISQTGYDKEKILALCYTAFDRLKWPVLYAGEDKLLANTSTTWKKGQQIIISATDNEISVTSEMIHGESFDTLGKNKKNIATFLTALDEAKNNFTAGNFEENTAAINALRTATLQKVEQDAREAEEVSKAMYIHGNNLYATYGIMAVNTLVFVLMAFDGAGIVEANGLVHIKWGSNIASLTLSGDWWRLITNTFIHFGIFHLAMNMYALYMVGIYLEPMLGKTKYITAYLCTGVLASAASLWWHTEPVNSAGASGAIFGLYGLFLALLTTSLIPKKVRDALLKSIGIFVVYNLAYGMKGGVDNSAHIGGLLSGFIIGYIYATAIKKEKEGLVISWVVPLIITVTLGIIYGYVNSHKISDGERIKILAELKEIDFKDSDTFNEKYNAFVDLQDKAFVVYNDSTTTDQEKRKQLKEISLPLWVQADSLARQMQSLNISPLMHKKADAVAEYIQLRIEELMIMDEMFGGNTTDSISTRLYNLRDKINTVVDSLR